MKIPWEEINELTKYLKDKGLTEISIETKDGKISIKKDLNGNFVPSVLPAVEKGAQSSVEQKASNIFELTSPMVGTFYASPSPGAETFAKVGSKIKSGDVVCIIEAMKIMNELPCEVSGTVLEILVKDSQIVEFGQVLMKIEK